MNNKDRKILIGDPRIPKITEMVDKDPEIIAMRADAYIKLCKIIDRCLGWMINDNRFMDNVKSGDMYYTQYWAGFCEAHRYISNYKNMLDSDIVKLHNDKFSQIERKVENGEIEI